MQDLSEGLLTVFVMSTDGTVSSFEVTAWIHPCGLALHRRLGKNTQNWSVTHTRSGQHIDADGDNGFASKEDAYAYLQYAASSFGIDWTSDLLTQLTSEKGKKKNVLSRFAKAAAMWQPPSNSTDLIQGLFGDGKA